MASPGTRDFKIKYTRKPKTVNLCPYCRAVVAAVVLAPFVALWRLFPHQKKEEMTYEQIKKRSQKYSKIVRTIAGGFFISLGLWFLIDGNILSAAVQFPIGLYNLFSVEITTWFIKRSREKRKSEKTVKVIHAPRRLAGLFKWFVKIFSKKRYHIKVNTHIKETLEEKHDVICPPIFFIDKRGSEQLK